MKRSALNDHPLDLPWPIGVAAGAEGCREHERSEHLRLEDRGGPVPAIRRGGELDVLQSLNAAPLDTQVIHDSGPGPAGGVDRGSGLDACSVYRRIPVERSGTVATRENTPGPADRDRYLGSARVDQPQPGPISGRRHLPVGVKMPVQRGRLRPGPSTWSAITQSAPARSTLRRWTRGEYASCEAST